MTKNIFDLLYHNITSLLHMLQITYKKVRNLEIGTDKFVEKVSINLLHHAAWIISIIINTFAIIYAHS